MFFEDTVVIEKMRALSVLVLELNLRIRSVILLLLSLLFKFC